MRYATAVPLGRGAMGEVLEAWDPQLERRVALKFLLSSDPDQVARFQREAKFQAKIRHPNVAEVYEVGEADGRPFIAMQLVDGVPIDEACRELPLERRVQLLSSVAEAVHAAHREGLIHRDLKPGNILVERDDEGVLTPYVLDFGIAREATAPGLTVTGQIVGTPGYLSPEQARGDTSRLDRRSDVFSLGAILYQVLTGVAPFASDSWARSLIDVLEREPVRPRQQLPTLPRDLETIVLTCLEKDPDRRYPSARALAEDLQHFLDGVPIAARPVTRIERLRRQVRRHPVAWTVGSLATVALLVLGAIAVRERLTAAGRARTAQFFGQEAERIEGMLQRAYLVPLHDIRPALEQARRRLQRIEARMEELDPVSRAAGDYALGRGHLGLGDPARGRLHLERSWNAGAHEPQVAWALSLALSRLYRQGLEELGTIAAPELRQARRAQLERELRDPALHYLERARGEGIHPEYVAASLAFFTGEHRQALEHLEAARSPWFYEADLLAADIHAELHRRAVEAGQMEVAREAFERAASAFDRAANVGESDPRSYEGLCGLWIQTLRSRYWGFGDDLAAVRQSAEEACGKALTANPDLASAHLRLATVYRFEADEQLDLGRSGDPHPALTKSRRHVAAALAADPDDSYAHVLLGVTYRNQGVWEMQRGQNPLASFDRALASYDRAAELAPTLYSVHLSRALTYLHTGDYLRRQGRPAGRYFERAIEASRRAVALEPELTGGYVNLGIAYGQLALVRRAHRDEALTLLDAGAAALARSIAINPEFTTAHYNLGELLLERGAVLLAGGDDPTAPVERGLALLGHVAAKELPYAPTHFLLLEGELLLARRDLAQGKDPRPRLARAAEQGAIGLELDAADPVGLLLHAECDLVAARWLLAQGADPRRRLDSARHLMRRALEIDPDLLEAAPVREELAAIEADLDRRPAA